MRRSKTRWIKPKTTAEDYYDAVIYLDTDWKVWTLLAEEWPAKKENLDIIMEGNLVFWVAKFLGQEKLTTYFLMPTEKKRRPDDSIYRITIPDIYWMTVAGHYKPVRQMNYEKCRWVADTICESDSIAFTALPVLV